MNFPQKKGFVNRGGGYRLPNQAEFVAWQETLAFSLQPLAFNIRVCFVLALTCMRAK